MYNEMIRESCSKNAKNTAVFMQKQEIASIDHEGIINQVLIYHKGTTYNVINCGHSE